MNKPDATPAVKIIRKRSDLDKAIGHLCDASHDRGLQLPWIVVAVALNGSIIAVRITSAFRGKGVKTEALAENFVDDTMVLPLNFMIVDAKGHPYHASVSDVDMILDRAMIHAKPQGSG